MSRNIIAVVKLAPGQAGYYDAVSGVYLTVASAIANVYQGMNTTRLQYAVKEKRIVLVSGSLTPLKPFSVEPACQTAKAKEAKVETAAKAEKAVMMQEETAKVEEIKPAKKKTVKKSSETVEAVATAETKEGDK